jgi:hypothetical protein
MIIIGDNLLRDRQIYSLSLLLLLPLILRDGF